jgi:beta-lactamase class A
MNTNLSGEPAMPRLPASNRRTAFGSIPAMVAVLVVLAAVLSACGTAGNSSGIGEVSQADNSTTIPALNTPIPIGKSPTPLPTATNTPVPSPTAIPSPTPLPYSDDWPAELATIADSMIDEEEGVFGVMIMEESGDVLYSRNSTVPFITASLYKLVLLADILKRVEQGELSLDEPITLSPDLFQDGDDGDTYFTADDIGGTATIRELLYYVGDYSSNVSARGLLRFTNWDSMNQTAKQAGMERTYLAVVPEDLPDWPPTPGPDSSQEELDLALQFVEDNVKETGIVNLTTSRDMAAYQLGLIKGTVVSPYVSAQILSILREQEIDDRIPALLDSRFEYAHKPGNLIHAAHDVGVIFTPGEPRVLSAMSEALIWDGRAHELIQRLALIATGQTNIPPISEAAMQDGGVVEVVFGPAKDAREIIQDPEVIRTPTPGPEISPEEG